MRIDDVLNKLLGDIQPLADTTIDGERICNIENYNDAIFYLINELIEASKCKEDDRKSAKDIGQKCNKVLLDLKETLASIEE